MLVDGIDALALKVLAESRKKEHVNANDTDSLAVLRNLRPHLYNYDRNKYKVKWSPGQGDTAGILRGMGKLPKIEGVQVVLR